MLQFNRFYIKTLEVLQLQLAIPLQTTILRKLLSHHLKVGTDSHFMLTMLDHTDCLKQTNNGNDKTTFARVLGTSYPQRSRSSIHVFTDRQSVVGRER